MAHLDAFAGNVPIAGALVELEPVGIELQVALLPCLQERAAELQHLSLDGAVSDLSESPEAYEYKYESSYESSFTNNLLVVLYGYNCTRSKY